MHLFHAFKNQFDILLQLMMLMLWVLSMFWSLHEYMVPMSYLSVLLVLASLLLSVLMRLPSAGEECCRFYAECYGLNTVCARPFNVYGPGCPGGDGGLAMGIWERQYREGKPLAITGNGSNVRDFVHVSDIVEGLLILGEKTWKGDIFDLGTGHGEKVRNVAGMFGCPIEFIGARDGEAPQSVANAWRTRQLTGWKAKINISDYIRSFTT